MSQPLFSVILVLSLSSIAFCDVTSSITSLVGKNAEGYLAPLGTMMGGGMNSGFYRKASPHKILGFDITVDFAYSMAPPGQTTYNFYIPNDSIDFPFQFQFPRSMFSSVMGDWESVIPSVEGNSALYQDQEIPFELAVKDLLNGGEGNIRAQNILGNDSTAELTFTLDQAIPAILGQIIENTWNIVDTIPGLGAGYTFVPGGPEIQLFEDDEAFTEKFGGQLDSLVRIQLDAISEDMPKIPIPGGFGSNFKSLPIDIGFPLPIVQASVGLPFHTEITMRGIPVAVPLASMGSIKFGGFGGKIGISDYLSDILYKSENELLASEKEDIQYVIDAQPSEIKPKDVSKAIYYLQLQEIEVQDIDSLNILFSQGDTSSVIEIQNRMLDAQLQLEAMPKLKKKKKKKKFPIDLSLGFYTNDFILDLESTGATGVTSGVELIDDGQANISATNRMISLQVGKTLNLPSYLAFLGGVGIYGGLGYEWSTLDLSYTLANPVAYGCFVNSEYTEMKTATTYYTEDNCTGSKVWESGVPTPIELSFTGDNKFRTLVGIRARILIVDVYADYNKGASIAYNFGLGITIR